MNRKVAKACRTKLLSLGFFAVILIASFVQTTSGQQRDGDGIDTASNTSSSAPSRTVNFDIIQLMNGEYLEMFGAGTSYGLLRGHPTAGIELGSHSADPLIFSTNTFERMRILANGFIGMGTTNPSSRLHVNGGTIRLAATSGQTPFQFYSHSNSDSLWLTSGNATKSEIHLSPAYAVNYDRSIALQYIPGTTGATAGILNVGQMIKAATTFTHGATAFYTNGAERLRINSAGNVGVGTTVPGHRLDVQGGVINASGGLCIAGDCRTAWSQVGGGGGSQWTTSGTNISYSAGNVIIGTGTPTEKLEVIGNIKVSGNINAKYQDVAEWVDSSQEIVAGTVVVLDSAKSNHVIASTQSYDSRVAGVISRQPGLTLGEAGEGRVLVATTGRVKVKVDTTNGPIQIGDLLVTSNREGFAMKSLPVELYGVRMHRPGTLIGKALEPLAAGAGEILVLLSLQ